MFKIYEACRHAGNYVVETIIVNGRLELQVTADNYVNWEEAFGFLLDNKKVISNALFEYEAKKEVSLAAEELLTIALDLKNIAENLVDDPPAMPMADLTALLEAVNKISFYSSTISGIVDDQESN